MPLKDNLVQPARLLLLPLLLASLLPVGGCSFFRTAEAPAKPYKPSVVIGPENLAPDSLLRDLSIVTYPSMDAPWIDTLISSMSRREKIAQLIVPFTFSRISPANLASVRKSIVDYGVGGYIISKGSVSDAAALIDSMQHWSHVPLLLSADFENGLTMRLTGATEFPTAMALGATGDPDLAYRMAAAVATEARALGVHHIYAPVADVNNNPSNPVINVRSYGEDAKLVADMAEAYMRGLQDGGIIATAKHFPGHGDTDVDSHTSLPLIPFERDRLDLVELKPFRRLIESGILSVMSAHIVVPALETDKDRPATFSARIMDTLLRRELGFNGLIITDALNMNAVKAIRTSGNLPAQALRAGADVLLMPESIPAAIDSVEAALDRRELQPERIDRSLRRMLSYKYWAGCWQHTAQVTRPVATALNTVPVRDLARVLASRSVTVVANHNSTLPLRLSDSSTVAIFFLGPEKGKTGYDKAHAAYEFFSARAMKRRSSGGISVDYFSASRLTGFRGKYSKWLSYADAVVVVPFLRFTGKKELLPVSRLHAEFFTALSRTTTPVVLVSLRDPYILASLPAAAASLCSYGSDEPSLQAAFDILFGDIRPHGRLPVSIPGIAWAGTGQDFTANGSELGTAAASGVFRHVDSLISQQILNHSFPGAQLLVQMKGKTLFSKCYGSLTYDSASPPVTTSTMYDIASLTKVVSTTSAVMMLYENGLIDLDAPVSRYLPRFSGEGKDSVKIRNLLMHNSGLEAFRFFYPKTNDGEAVFDSIVTSKLEYEPGTKTVYSDFGFILLARIVERITGMPIDRFLTRELLRPLGMKRSMFNPPDRLKSACAPTEVDGYWRHRLVQGTVHDETADLLGGVAGHAGLFSTAEDLALFTAMLQNGGQAGGKTYLSESTIRLFTDRQNRGSSRALGWDTRSSETSSAGKYFSMNSFGHTGFTGTSIWVDPEAGISVIFLTNRVYPSRKNKQLPRFRRVLHNAVREAVSLWRIED